jgi:CRISPR-associated endonuclease/helicase Cas3
VATALRKFSTLRPKSAPPLDVLELRGGIYRDNRWARSVTQPTIVCTTIDQLGSRLLFRGYGVSPNAAPIQAALVAYDSLVLLDEAHISRPFMQTLDFVKRYLDPARWTKQPIGVQPMIVVPMTATPPEGMNDAQVIRLSDKDRTNPGLDNRLKASKPATLRSVTDTVESVVTEAGALSKESPTAVGIIVNRVATAKAIYEKLREKRPDAAVELVIGSMRPVDRDRQAERLRTLVGPDRPKPRSEITSFVVATQCLEVGADYDFDVLITECASLDALRQRFGRLNRAGRNIEARALILIDARQVKGESQLDDDKPLDPIYGNALPRTWNLLNQHAESLHPEPGPSSTQGRRRRAASATAEIRRIDLGIDAFAAILKNHGDMGRLPANLLSPSASLDAPVMLPAYVDFWCQTSPRPAPDPEVSLFIHGPQAGEPDVQVCWRADLVEGNQSDWCDIVALLPPTSAECMSVPISRLRRWLADGIEDSDQGDLLGTRETAATDDSRIARQKQRLNEARTGVLWRGARDSDVIRELSDLRPGATLVLPVSAGGWNDLGHVPNPGLETIDVAEMAFRMARDRAVLRLHPTSRPRWPITPAITELFDRIGDTETPPTLPELQRLFSAVIDDLASNHGDLAAACRSLANPRNGLIRERYPDDRGEIVTTRRRLDAAASWYLPAGDEGEDDRSWTCRKNPILLNKHTQHVREEVIRTVKALLCDDMRDVFRLAAEWHDLGKADERFQAVLRRADRTDAWLLAGMDSAVLAKSDGLPQTPRQRKEARERAGLPKDFRHEMISVQIVEHGKLRADDQYQALILHLIAAHHGFARPFAPIVVDPEPPDVFVNGVTLSAADRLKTPPHRIDSGIAERFWTLTRRYGWWGLAYLEATLRLADQQASADEDADIFEADSLSSEPEESTV